MPDPFSPDPRWPAHAGADDIAADIERLRRTASRRRGWHQRLRREVRGVEVAMLGLLVVAAGFLALHLAERGNQVSLTLRTAATSPPTPRVDDRDTDQGARPEAGQTPKMSRTRSKTSKARASRTTVVTARHATKPHEAPPLASGEATTTLPPPSTSVPTTTTSTSTTTSTTTTSPTTTTTIGVTPPPP